MHITSVIFAIVVMTAPAMGATIEASVVNRFRLLQGQQQEDLYFNDLRQRLNCADQDRKKRFGCTSERASIMRGTDRPTPNYNTFWSSSRAEFQPDYVANNAREVRLRVAGLPRRMRSSVCQWQSGDRQIASGPCSDTRYQFSLDPRTRSATLNLAVRVQGLPLERNPASVQLTFRDAIIVSLGDSYISGEGNPHRSLKFLSETKEFRRAEWLDVRCHRSLFSGAAIAAARLARTNQHQSVTYLPLGCSGAEIKDGMITENYVGRETFNQAIWVPEPSDPPWQRPSEDHIYKRNPLPSQSAILRKALCSAECVKPDAVVVSSGGNEVGFGEFVSRLAKGGKIGDIAPRLAKLDQELQEMAKALAWIEPGEFLLQGYLNPTRTMVNGRIRYCSDNSIRLRGIPHQTFVPQWSRLFGLGITAEGAESADRRVLQPLNRKLSEFAAKQAGWRYLEPPNTSGAGYCNLNRSWFNTVAYSENVQGWISNDTVDGVAIGGVPSGSMHPNIIGHYNMSAALLNALALRNLWEPGKMRAR